MNYFEYLPVTMGPNHPSMTAVVCVCKTAEMEAPDQALVLFVWTNACLLELWHFAVL